MGLWGWNHGRRRKKTKKNKSLLFDFWWLKTMAHSLFSKKLFSGAHFQHHHALARWIIIVIKNCHMFFSPICAPHSYAPLWFAKSLFKRALFVSLETKKMYKTSLQKKILYNPSLQKKLGSYTISWKFQSFRINGSFPFFAASEL